MHSLQHILSRFEIPDEIVNIETISHGFINSTYKVVCTDASYILQRININVFPNVDELMSNITLVTEHIRRKNSKGMYVVPTKEGKAYFVEGDDFYRVYNFVENSKAYNSVESPEIFYQTGVGFGEFQNALADFDASKLYEAIADFHITPKRLANFRDAVQEDVVDRVKECVAEIEYLEENAAIAGIICDKLSSGELPYLVTHHNDTKLNNILFDADTNKPICAIDLDTVMPGSLLFDFGDAIRYGANPAGELGSETIEPHIDLALFKAFTDGFLSQTHQVLTAAEADLLPESVLVMAYELALRFLEDHLRGDVYFGAALEGINLQRAKVQIELCKNIAENMSKLKEITCCVLEKYRT